MTPERRTYLRKLAGQSFSETRWEVLMESPASRQRHAEFIVASGPTTVLALLDALDEADQSHPENEVYEICLGCGSDTAKRFDCGCPAGTGIAFREGPLAQQMKGLVDRQEAQLAKSAGAEAEREACAAIADEVIKNYPTSVWPEDGESIDCKSAAQSRLVARTIADSIRKRGVE